VHYYAHLDHSTKLNSCFIRKGQSIGTVGDSGNAKGKPCHLHYVIYTPIPYFWLADTGIQGWKKAFYLNPTPWLNASFINKKPGLQKQPGFFN
jgi:murein DD-endopeptidase MepM/ murein hydrolase activator NlpD